MPDQTFVIGGELLQAIANYLAGRPFREVAGIMQALQALQPEPLE